MPSTTVLPGFTGYRGPVLHFIGDPVTKEPEKNYEYLEDGLLVVSGGKVLVCKDAVEAMKEFGDDLEVVDCSDKVRGIYFRWNGKKGKFDRVPFLCISVPIGMSVSPPCAHSLPLSQIHIHTHSPPLAAYHAGIHRLPRSLPAD